MSDTARPTETTPAAQVPAVQPDPVKPGATQERPTEAWLILPSVRPDGRDSLGRGTGAGEIAAAVAADKAVQREREARWSYLEGAYRDPHAARAALEELVKRQGWTSAASRVAADPLQLGEPRGKEGLFAGVRARAEREAAQRAAGAIGPSLERIGAAEARAERTYRTSVEGQRAADATGIPRLSETAMAAIGAIGAAKDDRERAEAWRAAQAVERVARELAAFERAVAQRFGEDGVRAMLRTATGGAVVAASVSPDRQSALDMVASVTVTMKAAERSAAVVQRQVESERQGQRRGLRM